MVNLFDSMSLNYPNSWFKNRSLERETEVPRQLSFFWKHDDESNRVTIVTSSWKDTKQLRSEPLCQGPGCATSPTSLPWGCASSSSFVSVPISSPSPASWMGLGSVLWPCLQLCLLLLLTGPSDKTLDPGYISFALSGAADVPVPSSACPVHVL